VGRRHVKRCRQSLCNERHHADASDADVGQSLPIPRIPCRSRLAFGIARLSIIHFARWVLIRRRDWPNLGQPKASLVDDYMLFISNFNGTWDQYIDAFSDGLPSGLDLFWYSSTRYPHSIPTTPFKTYIRANQIDTDYYYNATPGAAQRDIKAALRVREAILALAEHIRRWPLMLLPPNTAAGS
jgi:hypothetical protein